MNWLLFSAFVAQAGARTIDATSDSKLTYVSEERFKKLSNEKSEILGNSCGIQGYGKEEEPHLKINGGQRAWNGQFPWTVTLWWTDKIKPEQPDEVHFEPICTATLISDRHVLAAGHCFFDDKKTPIGPSDDAEVYELRMTAGGTCNFKKDSCDEKRFNEEKYILNVKVRVVAVPNEFFSDIDGHDISILELEEPVGLDSRVTPACLPRANETYPLHSLVYEVGYGTDEKDASSADLRFLRSDFYGRDKNDSNHLIHTAFPLSNSPGNHLKLGQVNGGDSGAGLIYYNQMEERFYSLGVLSTGDNGFVNYVDLRYFVELICRSTGICYMTN